jgi:hypothetical protein
LLESYVEKIAAPAFARRLAMASNGSAAAAFGGSDAPDEAPHRLEVVPPR